MAATIPIGIPASGGINPAAGGTAASPATAPVASPSADGRRYIQLRTIQVKAAAAAEAFVATKALAASPPEERGLPALKPNQPNPGTPVPAAPHPVCYRTIYHSEPQYRQHQKGTELSTLYNATSP